MMKIGIVSDTHFGYSRFYEDTLNQGREAILNAIEKSDLLIHAGDMFDTRLPSLETLNKVLDIWKEAKTFKKPIMAIHGNHERRIKGYVNPVKLLSTSGMIKYLHGDVFSFEKEGERINILGVGSVPEEHSLMIIGKAVEKNKEKLKEGKNILVIHQMIKEMDPTENSNLSLSYLEGLGFDLIINGHIHRRYIKRESKLIIPGSTVVTSLDDNEVAHKRGFVIYDTKDSSKEFYEIKQRTLFSETIEFNNASYEEITEMIEKKYNELKSRDKNSVIRIKIRGKLREGLLPSLIPLPSYKDLYVKNSMFGSLKEEFEKVKKNFNYENVNKWAFDEIRKRLKGKTSISGEKLLDILSTIENIDEGAEVIIDEE